MCVQSQPYSRLEHVLLAAYGASWRKVYLAMFNVYIDDSGTDPSQHVAIASGLIIAAKQAVPFQSEWSRFIEKQGITDFHTAECVARNPRSQFANWDEVQVKRVLQRVRQIIRKYSVQAFSISVDKAIYDAAIPEELRKAVGRYHYTWAVDAVCGFIWSWANDHNVPMEYIFDHIDKSQKAQRREIEKVMEHGEELHPGSFAGHYSFRKREEIPALQCADLFAWTCYQQSLAATGRKPLSLIARENWEAFGSWDDDRWCGAWIASKEQMEDWVRRVYADPAEMKRIRSDP